MMQPLGLGVLGLGEGRSIISAGVHSDLWRVACLCDTNAGLARQRCAEFGVDAWTTDYAALLARDDLVRWYLPDITEVMGYAYLSNNGRAGGLVNPDTYHFVLKAADGRIARVTGVYSCPTVPAERDSPMTCILRCDEGASQADYHELRYAWKIGEQAAIESFEAQRDYFFRFGGHTHHAGEYQNYIEYFARCLQNGETPQPDVPEGLVTVALMQAMDEAAQTGAPVQVRAVLARYGLEHLV